MELILSQSIPCDSSERASAPTLQYFIAFVYVNFRRCSSRRGESALNGDEEEGAQPSTPATLSMDVQVWGPLHGRRFCVFYVQAGGPI